MIFIAGFFVCDEPALIRTSIFFNCKFLIVGVGVLLTNCRMCEKVWFFLLTVGHLCALVRLFFYWFDFFSCSASGV